MSLSLNERWTNVIRNCNIDLTQPINYVKTSDIAKHGGKETRLMVSIGTERALPQIFKQHGVFLLPLSRSKVAIVRGKGYHKVEEITSPIQTHSTEFAFPVSLKGSQGEEGYLELAYTTALLGRFTQRPQLRHGFVAKRRVSFSFRVDGLQPLQVEGAQIEVDASFEDSEKYYLTEAKYRTPESFNIRQLYYPYKYYRGTMPRNLEVKCLFFSYEPAEDPMKAEYRFWEYNFKDPEDLEQIELAKSARYNVAFSTKKEPLREFAGIKPVPQMRAIQANDVFKMMDLPLLIVDGVDDAQKLAFQYAFDARQSSYYSDAMRTLGLITKRGTKYALTSEGEKYVNLSIQERTKFFLRKLMEYPPINEIIQRVLIGEVIGERDLNQIAKKHDPTVSKSTIPRRASSLRSFFRFIADATGYCKVENGKISRVNPRESLNGWK